MDLVSAYTQFSQDTVDVTGLSRPMLHLLAGLVIYLPGRLFFGGGRGSLIAIFLVLQAELGNELLNMLHYGSWRWPDTIADVSLTLLGPVMCCCFWSSNRSEARPIEKMSLSGANETKNRLDDQVKPRLVAVRIRCSEGRNVPDLEGTRLTQRLQLAA